MSLQSQFAEHARSGGRAVLVTVLRAGDAPVLPGSKLLIISDGETTGSLGDTQLDSFARSEADGVMWQERSESKEHAGALLFFDVCAPPPRLVVFGAVDFAAELCRLARACGWRAYVVDPRARFATPQRFPDAFEVVVSWPQQAFERIGAIDRATYIAVLTHDPKLDDAALSIALRSDAAYVGAMGSRRAQAARRERLAASGFESAELDRVAAPIGLDLGALSAEETALSIMAEVVAVRNGRAGGRLSESSGRIHEVPA